MRPALTRRVLALDAAGASCSAALLSGDACLGERRGGDSRAAAASLPVMVQALLDEHGPAIDAVAATVGPGSFTGLRAALALAHGIALGAGVPVLGVTVSEALRLGDERPGAVWVALDSRRAGRIYLDTGRGMAACLLDALPVPSGRVTVLGDAAAAVCAISPHAVAGQRITVAAADVGRVAQRRLAGEIGPCEPQPLYVEPPAVTLVRA